MAEELQNLDIRDFTAVSGLDASDYVLLVLAGGTAGRVSVGMLKKSVSNSLQPSIQDGYWWIGDTNTEVVAEGMSAEFRKGELGVEWKYTTEDETKWRLLVNFTDITWKFDDLTDEQKQLLIPHLSDLTEEEIAELQQPAANMIATLEETNKSVSEAETARANAETARASAESERVKAETDRADEFAKLKKASEEATSAATQAKTDADAATKSAKDAATAANDAAGKVTDATTDLTKEREAVTEAAAAAIKSADTADRSAEAASKQAARAKEIADHQPYMGDNGNWWQWNSTTQKYEDSGRLATGGIMYPTFYINKKLHLIMRYQDTISKDRFYLNRKNGHLYFKVK